MNELEKMNRIIKRVVPEGPHETLLVVDATTDKMVFHKLLNFLRLLILQGLFLQKWMVLLKVELFYLLKIN